MRDTLQMAGAFVRSAHGEVAILSEHSERIFDSRQIVREILRLPSVDRTVEQPANELSPRYATCPPS